MNAITSNTAYLSVIQLVLTMTIIVYTFLVPQHALLWLFSIGIYTIIGALGISIGFHRLLTHRSFKTHKWIEYLFTWLGCLAFTGSSIGWVGMHRDHHKHSDGENDPHSPINKGWKMLIARYDFSPNKWAVKYLVTDRFHSAIHRYYFGLLLLWTLAFAAFGLTSMMHFVLIPATISIWVSTISNYMNHMWGYVSYQTTDNSRNNWLNALFTFGEGWHNNHHARPGAWNFGHKWWEIDVASWIIRLIKK